jgi:hypothetical protein
MEGVRTHVSIRRVQVAGLTSGSYMVSLPAATGACASPKSVSAWFALSIAWVLVAFTAAAWATDRYVLSSVAAGGAAPSPPRPSSTGQPHGAHPHRAKGAGARASTAGHHPHAAAERHHAHAASSAAAAERRKHEEARQKKHGRIDAKNELIDELTKAYDSRKKEKKGNRTAASASAGCRGPKAARAGCALRAGAVYRLLGNGLNCSSQPGYAALTTVEECKAAVAAVGGIGMFPKSQAKRHYPKGCSKCNAGCSAADKDVLFFNVREGLANPNHDAVCRQVGEPQGGSGAATTAPAPAASASASSAVAAAAVAAAAATATTAT